MKKYPLGKTENLVVQNLEDETLLYNLKTNKALCLNETSALIWEMCDGRSSISQIAEKLGKRLKKPVADEVVWLAVDQLKNEGLLANADEVQNNFDGLSRREVIRKVGFASVIALPIVSAVVAPKAIAAQSGCPFSVGACLPPTLNICVPECIGVSGTYTSYNSTDGTCTGGTIVSGIPFTCTPVGFGATIDISIDSLV